MSIGALPCLILSPVVTVKLITNLINSNSIKSDHAKKHITLGPV
jgi:hypothetical protein